MGPTDYRLASALFPTRASLCLIRETGGPLIPRAQHLDVRLTEDMQTV